MQDGLVLLLIGSTKFFLFQSHIPTLSDLPVNVLYFVLYYGKGLLWKQNKTQKSYSLALLTWPPPDYRHTDQWPLSDLDPRVRRVTSADMTVCQLDRVAVCWALDGGSPMLRVKFEKWQFPRSAFFKFPCRFSHSLLSPGGQLCFFLPRCVSMKSKEKCPFRDSSEWD